MLLGDIFDIGIGSHRTGTVAEHAKISPGRLKIWGDELHININSAIKTHGLAQVSKTSATCLNRSPIHLLRSKLLNALWKASNWRKHTPHNLFYHETQQW
jgi:hypothetical protein